MSSAFEVTVEHKQSLQDDGIVKLPGLIDDVLLDELNRCFGWSVAHPGPIAAGSPEGDNVFFVDNANPEARPTREVAADGLRRRLEALGYVD